MPKRRYQRRYGKRYRRRTSRYPRRRYSRRPKGSRRRFSRTSRRLAARVRKYITELKWSWFVVAYESAPASINSHFNFGYRPFGTIAHGDGAIQREGLKIRAKRLTLDLNVSGGKVYIAYDDLPAYAVYRVRCMVFIAHDDELAVTPGGIWEDSTNADMMFLAGFDDAVRRKWKLLWSKTVEIAPYSVAGDAVPHMQGSLGFSAGQNWPQGKPWVPHIQSFRTSINLKAMPLRYVDTTTQAPTNQDIVVCFARDIADAAFSEWPSIWGGIRYSFYDD